MKKLITIAIAMAVLLGGTSAYAKGSSKGSNKTDKSDKKTFEKGCKVDAGGTKKTDNSKPGCETLDSMIDGGDGPNAGAVQGKK